MRFFYVRELVEHFCISLRDILTKNQQNMKAGMIKLSVFYPNQEGKTFDMDYYCNKHIPMVAQLLGDAVKGASVEEGLGGGAPGDPATYIAMGNLYFDSMESFQNSFGPNAEQIMADVPNYTNIEPVVQLSKAMV